MLAASLGLSACGSAAQNTRADVGFNNYVRALRGDDPRPVYEMLTRDQQKNISFEEWSALWKDSQAERGLQAKQLEERLKTHGVLEERAKLQFDDGKLVTLRRNDRGWTLDQPLVSRSRADTPRDALNILSAAVTDRSVPALLQILSKERRQSVEKKIETIKQSLDSQLEDGWRELYFVDPKNPERAELVWSHQGVRYKVVLVKEDGDWLVDDLHLGPDPLVEEPTDEEAESAGPPAPPPPFRR